MTDPLLSAPFAAELPAYISVDVETAGPIPGVYSLLSIGACTVMAPRQTFYVELQPEALASQPEALAVHGLSLEALRQTGLPPKEAMQAFARWLQATVPAGQHPLFVALNAPFDWAFVNDAFHRHLGENPFGHSAIDIKAFYMGLTANPWSRTGWKEIQAGAPDFHPLVHNALQDAQDQGDLFFNLLQRAAAARHTS
ncbi:MAG TPA: 3'-5' exonuclease [Anaerolineaceae bacterium]|nr:3'-5' exonuclease [Anaerolineaceae bacterium]